MHKFVEIIVPAHNEEHNIQPLYEEISNVFKTTDYKFKIIFVDDGSTDATLATIKDLSIKDEHVHYITFSRNFGHQNAIKAGLDYCKGEVVVMMDCDLQHPPNLIAELLRHYEQGYDIVRTHRAENHTASLMKKKTSAWFYQFMNKFSDINLEEGSADFRLISGDAVHYLRQFNEYDLFYRGLIKWIGFNQISIKYEPEARRSGTTKYTYKKMLSFGLKGFTSFSIRPLYVAAYLGMIFSLLSTFYIPYIIYAFYNNREVQGWASVLASVVFFGGLNLMILGVIGIYLGKLFIQNKNRPHYIVKESNL
jgi:dolichol-phosphate mannosyltransferase